mmetsp:Transcript_23727/g.60099  ORF Transcript_23727/g.60099 Transcript_23727/m.60099 type:complete len:222 (-) Transcript_23727:1091-1756(-)
MRARVCSHEPRRVARGCQQLPRHLASIPARELSPHFPQPFSLPRSSPLADSEHSALLHSRRRRLRCCLRFSLRSSLHSRRFRRFCRRCRYPLRSPLLFSQGAGSHPTDSHPAALLLGRRRLRLVRLPLRADRLVYAPLCHCLLFRFPRFPRCCRPPLRHLRPFHFPRRRRCLFRSPRCCRRASSGQRARSPAARAWRQQFEQQQRFQSRQRQRSRLRSRSQ